MLMFVAVDFVMEVKINLGIQVPGLCVGLGLPSFASEMLIILYNSAIQVMTLDIL
jgi:hypothetical protein